MGVLQRLTKRSQFLLAARGRKWNSPYFLLQVRARPDAPCAPPRFGFTVTKKVGNAVVRNRIRRRLKEALRRLAADGTIDNARLAGTDYVLIARVSALQAPFELLVADLARGLRNPYKRNRKRCAAEQETRSEPGKEAGDATEPSDE